MKFSFRPLRGRRALVTTVAMALTVSLVGVTAPAQGDPAEDPPAGYRNIAQLRSVLHSTYAANNYNNTGHLVTDGIYTDPTTPAPAKFIATASSGTGASAAGAAFDYALNAGGWLSTGNLNNTPQWVAIDLLAPTAVRSYRIQPLCSSAGNNSGLPQNFPTDWEFQGSNDGSTWTTLDTRAGMTGANGLPCRGATFPTGGANYQHYQLRVTAAQNYGTGVNPPPTSSTAANVVRIGELHLFGNDATNVVPSPDFLSFWQSSTVAPTAAAPQYVTVDLGGSSDFDKVNLLWNSDTTALASDYDIQVSDDGQTFTTVQSVAGASGWNQTVNLTPPVVGKQFVRVNFTTRVGADLRLQELEVWGTNSVAYTLPAAPAPEADGKQFLTGGNWKVQRAYQGDWKGESLSTAVGATASANWLPATVPGTVLTSYLNADAIVDPDFSDWQTQISDSYFTQSDWWYTDSFEIPAGQAGHRTWLNFQAINWKANVYLNGHRLGTAARSIADGDWDLEGAYTPGKFDITQYANYGGPNYLAVLIKKNDYPGAVTLQTLASAGGNGGALGSDNPTIHASIGWDWLPTIRGRNIGIYEDVYLDYSQDVQIENPWVVNELDIVGKDFSQAGLTVKAELTNSAAATRYVVLSGTISRGGTSVDVEAPGWVTIPARTTVQVSLPQVTVDNPELWWPNMYGDQPLYDVNLTAFASASAMNGYETSDTVSFKHGIRQVSFEWRAQPDLEAKETGTQYKPAAGFNIYVNGTRVVARGGNWGLSDRNTANTAEDFDLKMRLHAEDNLNIVRNWVGMTGHPGFYEAADKYGIMIMDDFWLANPYDGPNAQDEKLFTASAAAKVKRVRQHAAVTFYCGRNEGWPSPTLEPVLRGFTATGSGTLDPTRAYVADSAGVREGLDGHGPYGVRDAIWYFDNTPAARGYNSNGNGAKNLSSERGQLNIPTIESMHRMLGDNIPFPPVTSTPGVNVWGLHDFTTSGATEAARELDHITNTYDANYATHGVEEFIKTAQLMNYDNHRAMYEAVYVNDTPGLMQWMSQSAWPSMAWQTYDFYYDLSGGYYGEKIANQPVNPILDLRDQTIFLSNESTEDLTNVTVKAEVYSLQGVKVGESSTVTSLEAGGRSSQFTQAEDLATSTALANVLYKRVGPPLLSMPVIDGLSGTRFVRTSVTDTNGKVLGSNFYWTNPDTKAVWPAGSRTNRGTNAPNAGTWTDYKAIRTVLKGTDALPVDPVPVLALVSETASPEPGWGGLQVKLTNNGSLPALQVHINGKDENGEQILPFIADDNYVTLMPGESRTLSVKYQLSGRKGNLTKVGVDGFNVTSWTAPIAADPSQVEILKQMIQVYSLYEAQESRYTPASFAPFRAAMDAARLAVAAVPPSETDVAAGIVAIPATAAALVDDIDTSTLVALIADAQAILDSPTDWVPTFLSDLLTAKNHAEALLATPGFSQVEVAWEEVALQLAIAKVLPKGDKSGLAALIAVTQSLDGAQFTPTSWARVATALAAGIVVRDEPLASKYDVQDAFDALSDALSSLVLRAAKAGLKSAIDLGQLIVTSASLYVPASLVGLQAALDAANTVYADADATQAQVAAAQTALIAKIAVARLRPVAGGSPVNLLAPKVAAGLALEPAGVAVEVAAAQAALPKAFVKSPKPKITGVKAVGSKLKVKAGKWRPAAQLKFQWLRNGKPIAKAIKATYKVKAADKGKKISVKVTASKTGYTSKAKKSAKKLIK